MMGQAAQTDEKLGPWERVGTIGVDAGLCWLGDPCYLLGEGPRPIDLGKDWAHFCENLAVKEKASGIHGVGQFNYDLGHVGLGVTVSTGYGDGTYGVYVRRAEGHVKAVMVVFDVDAAHEEGVE
jgi:hypothetical protein